MQKKKWQNPELIVLVRGKPEEAVLSACKGGAAPIDPSADAGSCAAGALACNLCLSQTSS